MPQEAKKPKLLTLVDEGTNDTLKIEWGYDDDPSPEDIDFLFAQAKPQAEKPPVSEIESRRALLPSALREQLAGMEVTDPRKLERELAQAGTTEQPGLEMATAAEAALAPARGGLAIAEKAVKGVVEPVVSSIETVFKGLEGERLRQINPRKFYSERTVDEATRDITRDVSDVALGTASTFINTIPGMVAANAGMAVGGEEAVKAGGEIISGVSSVVANVVTPELDKKILDVVSRATGEKFTEKGLGYGIAGLFGVPVLVGAIFADVSGAIGDKIINDTSLKEWPEEDQLRFSEALRHIGFFSGMVPASAAKNFASNVKALGRDIERGTSEGIRETGRDLARQQGEVPSEVESALRARERTEPLPPQSREIPILKPGEKPTEPSSGLVTEKGDDIPLREARQEAREAQAPLREAERAAFPFEAKPSTPQEKPLIEITTELGEKRRIELPDDWQAGVARKVAQGKPLSLEEQIAVDKYGLPPRLAVRSEVPLEEKARIAGSETRAAERPTERRPDTTVPDARNTQQTRVPESFKDSDDALAYGKAHPDKVLELEARYKEMDAEAKKLLSNKKLMSERENRQKVVLLSSRANLFREAAEQARNPKEATPLEKSQAEDVAKASKPPVETEKPAKKPWQIPMEEYVERESKRESEEAPDGYGVSAEKDETGKIIAYTYHNAKGDKGRILVSQYQDSKVSTAKELAFGAASVAAQRGQQGLHSNEELRRQHMEEVQRAIGKGETIPPEVLQDYNAYRERLRGEKKPPAETPIQSEWREGNFFKQKDKLSCGACSVKSVLMMHGKKTDIDYDISDGTSPKRITSELEKAGVATEVKDRISVDAVEPKSIAYYPKEDHYVSIEKVEQDRLYVNDSSKEGPEWVSKKDFEAKWLKDKNDRSSGWVIATTSKAAETVKKELWQMTRTEVQTSATYQKGDSAKHKKAIEKALSEGKPVPPEVLKDYPELAKKGKPAGEPFLKETQTRIAREESLTKQPINELPKEVGEIIQSKAQSEIFSVASIAAYQGVDALPIDDDTKKALKAILGLTTVVGIASALSPRGKEILKDIEGFAKRKGVPLSKSIGEFFKSAEAKELSEGDRTALQKLAESPKVNIVATEVAKKAPKEAVKVRVSAPEKQAELDIAKPQAQEFRQKARSAGIIDPQPIKGGRALPDRAQDTYIEPLDIFTDTIKSLTESNLRTAGEYVKRQPGGGELLVRDINRDYRESAQWAGKLERDWRIASKGLSEKEWKEFVEIADKGSLGGNFYDPQKTVLNLNVKRALEAWDKIRKEIADAAQERGLEMIAWDKAKQDFVKVPFTPRENFFPHEFDMTEVQTQQGRARFIESFADKLNLPMAEAEQVFNKWIRSRIEKKYGHLEYARNFDVPGWKETRDVIPVYIERATRRIKQAEIYGKDYNIAQNWIEQILQNKGDYRAAQQLFDRVVGRERYDDAFSRLLIAVGAKANSWQSATKLTLLSLLNWTQLNNGGLVSGWRSLAKTLGRTITDREGLREFSDHMGGILESTLQMHMKAENTLEGIGGKMLKLTGVTRQERILRSLSANAIADYFKREGYSLVKGKDNTRLRATLQRKLNYLELGNVINLDKVAKRGGFSEKELLDIGYEGARKTQFLSRPQDVQFLISDRRFKIFTQFKSFIVQQTKLLNDAVIKEARHGNLMPLAYLVSMFPIAGEIAQDIRSFVTGRSRPDDLLERIVEDFATVGALGIIYDMFQQAARDPQGLISWMAGPTANEMSKVGYGISQAAQGNAVPLGRVVVGQIPVPIVQQQLQRMLEKEKKTSEYPPSF